MMDDILGEGQQDLFALRTKITPVIFGVKAISDILIFDKK